MENRVYVQMDKVLFIFYLYLPIDPWSLISQDTQTSLDKQFAFVCQLAAGQAEIAANGTHDEYKWREKETLISSAPFQITPYSYFSSSTINLYRQSSLNWFSNVRSFLFLLIFLHLSGTTPLAAKSIDAYANLMKDPIVPIVSYRFLSFFNFSLSSFSIMSFLIQNSDSIRRVSVISRDNHFGNWPIPGARPFNTQMKVRWWIHFINDWIIVANSLVASSSSFSYSRNSSFERWIR